ncbi:fluoride efflux transporter CrcB [Thiohalophilus thiocyanatoxydans]|uniref:Fluoride-specific ion channel FluC n=1 Tax=Thiohalophilus thiocyanatoxydans TaxID=381308 RepID=A0A4R8IPE8_9GAMM|nr:fluoride efflux transporter CrcB [Thiohalophilus thiocyanatoxydans]TDY02801.1 CrcB protein [Thiohalophilus thiocyanatoxydans]
MLQILAIAVGGAIGSVLRFTLSGGVHQLLGREFPYGTLSVNVLGSLLMGFLYIVLLERASLGAEWRALLLIGLLGAFTTFSTFSLETLNLIESGALIKAGMNILLSVTLCLLAAWVGMLGGRQL